VQFIKRLRPELKFDSAEALIAQMRQDVVDTRDVFAHPEPPPEPCSD
jgi:FAD synthase